MSAKPSQSPISGDRALSLQPLSQQHYGSGQGYSIPMPPSNPPRYSENATTHQPESTTVKDQPPQQPETQAEDQQVASSGQAHTAENFGTPEAAKEVVANAPTPSAPATESEKAYGQAKDTVDVVQEIIPSSAQLPASAACAGSAEGTGNDIAETSATLIEEPKSPEVSGEAQADEEAIAGAWIPWIQDPASEEFLEGSSDEAEKVPVSPSNCRAMGEAVGKGSEAKNTADETDDIWGWVSSPKNSP